MPILPLPEATACQLGATLAIPTPVVVVKELIENALDAGATVIAVFVSSNTVDRIEVRDNGPGIASNDFDALGRPGYTSKLQDLDDLANVGCSTFGFRGAALASIRNLADVIIATRTSTEPIASVLHFLHEGGIEKVGTKAASVGTMVCATKLFSNLPVRLRTIVRDSKSISKIRELLKSYVLVRPDTKMMFKILDSPQAAWTYSPKPGANIKEAVVQLFGAGLASQCSLKVFPNRQPNSQHTGTDEQPYETPDDSASMSFQAFLPLPSADPEKVRHGAFLAVDSRPISPNRFTGKKILSLFRKHINRSIYASGCAEPLKDPFIQLNIRCRPGSYDVNVEPEKDDVIFTEEKQLFDQLEQFFSSIYSSAPEDEVPAPVYDPEIATHPSPRGTRDARPPAMGTKTLWKVDMSQGVDLTSDHGDDDDGDEAEPTTLGRSRDRPELDSSDTRTAKLPPEKLNPWLIARLAAPRQSSEPQPLGPAPPRRQSPARPPTPERAITPPQIRPVDAVPRPQIDGVPQERQNRPVTVPGGPYRTSLPAARGRKQIAVRSRTSFPSTHKSQRSRPIGVRPPHISSRSAPTDLNQTRLLFNNWESSRRDQENRSQHDCRVANQPRTINAAAMSHQEGGENLVDERTLMENLRTVAETEALNAQTETEIAAAGSKDELDRTALEAGDARAYLFRRQRSSARHPEKTLRRVRTDLLPLEMTPYCLKTHGLLLTIEISTSQLSTQVRDKATYYDKYSDDDYLQGALKDPGAAILRQKVVAFLLGIGVVLPDIILGPPGPLRA